MNETPKRGKQAGRGAPRPAGGRAQAGRGRGADRPVRGEGLGRDERAGRGSAARGERAVPGSERRARGERPVREGGKRRARGGAATSARAVRVGRPAPGRTGHGRQSAKRPVSARPSPRKQKDPARAAFRRRLLTVLLVILLAVGATFVAVKYALSKIEKHTVPVNPVEQFEPVACSSGSLSTAVNSAGGAAGQQVTLSASITNKGEAPCYFDAADLRLQLTSGDQTVYDSQVCSSGPASKILLLDADMTTTQALSWNGVNAGANCQGKSIAGAGTYVARILLGSDPILQSGYVFELSGSGVATGGRSVTNEGESAGDSTGGAGPEAGSTDGKAVTGATDGSDTTDGVAGDGERSNNSGESSDAPR